MKRKIPSGITKKGFNYGSALILLSFAFPGNFIFDETNHKIYFMLSVLALSVLYLFILNKYNR